jgi:diacylglycerol kinase (ATP)
MEAIYRYFFIINPISGKGKGTKLIPEIEKICSSKNCSFEIHISKFSGDAKNLAEKALNQKFDFVIAVGGDGTVNEVASIIAGTSTTLGIIPIGSGNGLAREMKIPLDNQAALRFIFNGEIRKIDTGNCNNHFFACTSGVGFDAHLAHTFLKLQNRGLKGYVQLFLKEFFGYKTKKYFIQTDNETIETDAFLITVANCRQWGNDFFISPKSNYQDGQFEICVIKKFPLYIFPILVYRILCKNIHQSRYYFVIKTNSLILKSNVPNDVFHADGECFDLNEKLVISNNYRSLNVISYH